MPKFNNESNLNSAELNTGETESDINAAKEPENEPMREGLEQEKELGAEKPKLSAKEQIKNLDDEIEARQQDITILTKSIEGTKARLNETREQLGLPPSEEEHGISLERDRLEKLKAEQEALEKQKEKLTSQQEKERLVHEEKEKILQEKLNELFKEFESLGSNDLESILKSGKTAEGHNVESKSMGYLDPETARSLVKSFKEGIRLLPKILEALPNLLKKFDEDLTNEAVERVDKKLKEEKTEAEEGPKIDESADTPEDEDSFEQMTR